MNSDMIYICREFGWDYYTYIAQPVWFIQNVLQFLYRENQEKEREAKRLESKYGNR